ncbi:MAG: S-layer homology domain-containing protein, partial [Lachnospiraceae bacterium]|nr:S-layer homology domain-containing protein [Lachnospiraceae bacterium]
MKKILRKIFIAILSTLILLNANLISFGATTAGQEMRTQVLYLADIIKNDNNMNEFVTRGDFARMIVKASTYKDTTNLTEGASAFSDVEISDENSSFIKVATREGYIASYLGGLFKPNEFVMYRDLIRACIALLGYENSDFTGNQVNGRYELFCSLRMNENIDKTINEYVTKKDCVNAIYNTLKTNKKNSSSAYGPSVFTKMSVNSDGELNATGLIKTKLEGPFILKSGEA